MNGATCRKVTHEYRRGGGGARKPAVVRGEKRQRTGALQDAGATERRPRRRDSVLECASPLALFTTGLKHARHGIETGGETPPELAGGDACGTGGAAFTPQKRGRRGVLDFSDAPVSRGRLCGLKAALRARPRAHSTAQITPARCRRRKRRWRPRLRGAGGRWRKIPRWSLRRRFRGRAGIPANPR